MAATNTFNQPPRPRSSPGRLFSVTQGENINLKNLSVGGNNAVIYLPMLPKVIEMAREAKYDVSTTPTDPDGIHVYRGTEPLAIPISFSLHYSDPYLDKGALDLLRIGALLHAFTLPMRPVRPITSAPNSEEQATVAGETPLQQAQRRADEAARYQGSDANLSITSGQQAQIDRDKADTPNTPPVCVLDLISSAEGYGIVLYGYVRSVGVKLMGPYLQVRGGGNTTRNLPTSAEYQFTFVCIPSYRNTGSPGDNRQSVYSELVASRFYNVLDVGAQAGGQTVPLKLPAN